MTITDTLSKLKGLLFGSKLKIIISSASLFVAAVGITAAVMLGSHYSISGSIKFNVEMVPADAGYYIEIADLKQLYEIIPQTHIGKELAASQQWKNFFHTPEIMKLKNMLYLLEVKSGSILTLENIPLFFDGPIGIANFGPDATLISAKTNIKSQFGIALLTALKGKKVEIKKDEKPKAAKGDGSKIISKGSYNELFSEKTISLDNITITRFALENNTIYLTMIDGYLFMSENLDVLKASLELGSNKGGSSLASLNGMDTVYDSLEKNNIVVYLNSSKSIAAPLLQPTTNATGMAFVFNLTKDKPLSADIYTIDPQNDDTKQEVPASYQKNISRDVAAVFYSNSTGYHEIVQSLDKLGKSWQPFAGSVKGFLNAAGIDQKSFFRKNSGCAFIFNNITLYHKMAFPAFSFGYDTRQKPDKIAQAIFRVNSGRSESYQGTGYTAFKTRSNTYYRPSLLKGDKFYLLTSHNSDMHDMISAQKGNKPLLSDLASYSALGSFADAPHHLVLNTDKIITSFKNFFYYGADKTYNYSRKTVDKDIMPLFNTFSKYKTVHIAYGKKGDQSGRLVVSDKQ